MAHIVLDKASVELAVYNSRGRALKHELFRRTVGGGVEDRRDSSVQVVKALREVSFEARDGDRIGLIGGNGAGKTTLLRVLSRVYPPTGGRAEIDGRVSSLIDLSMGMDTDATGYENIIMRGVMLGLHRKQAEAITQDVEEFSELGEFLDLPIRTYSSGMMLRLAFAVSTAVQPDILILDEVIGVGDAAFAERAELRMHNMITNANIVFLASHSDETIKRFCNRTLWMKSGSLMADGTPEEVLAAYHADAHHAAGE
ncbi:ABC transporter ATP-binding protein [Bosea psychrotolerans]|uniref:ABC-2 type transport system ATP-binding protein/lipopolysaccharide transport system ATP-binding protein n=1 Tax=Bosea psychrotolerans TaxID=1871628 RepID=A0A2S4LYA3_9HYPH|nr:ABC transporter ATP-binding protein [Bosea psychrotolerans]POR47335.1 ABC-2 type transport system ATP-binding protein/lipopolysaccharide transport system ATP-binding protein [Bosea psychrotolerans]